MLEKFLSTQNNYFLNNRYLKSVCSNSESEREKIFCGLPEVNDEFHKSDINNKILWVLYDFDHVKFKKDLSGSLLNHNRINELRSIGFKNDVLRHLYMDYLDDTETNLALLDGYVENLEYSSINDIGHTLAGSSSNVGAHILAKAFERIDSLKPSDNLIKIEASIEEARAVYGQTKTEILAYLENDVKAQQTQ